MLSLAVMPVFVASTENLTNDLSNEALGAYLRLLMRIWTHDCAPFADNDRRLAGAVKVTPQKWRRLRPELEPFFEIGPEGWRHPALEKLWNGGMEKRDGYVEKGRRGGNAKWFIRQVRPLSAGGRCPGDVAADAGGGDPRRRGAGARSSTRSPLPRPGRSRPSSRTGAP